MANIDDNNSEQKLDLRSKKFDGGKEKKVFHLAKYLTLLQTKISIKRLTTLKSRADSRYEPSQKPKSTNPD